MISGICLETLIAELFVQMYLRLKTQLE